MSGEEMEMTCTRCDSDYDRITSPLPTGRVFILTYKDRRRVYEVGCFSAKVIE